MSSSEKPAASSSPDVELYPASEHDVHIGVSFDTYRLLRPIQGKIRAENLLWNSLSHAGVRETWEAPLRAIQSLVGRDRTIWTVVLDHESGALSWEIRVLNDDDGRGALGVFGPLREALMPGVELPAVESLPEYAVLTLRFDATSAQSPAMAIELHQPGATPRQMQLSRIDGDGLHPIGHDVALHPKRDIHDVLAQIKDSRFVDYSKDRQLLGRALVPELFACRRVYVGRRDDCDVLGFSGINIDQLKFVHARFEFPEAMRAYLNDHRDRLEHIMFDVTTEYVGRDGKIANLRTGFRSCF
ncbi:MAG: hypothetical protein AAF799_22145 [Myxococcota bacterium]